MNWISLLVPIFNTFLTRVFPDPEKRAQAELEMQKAINAAQAEYSKAQAIKDEAKKSVIVAEMQQSSWFADWRAKLMMGCTAMILFNWIIAPMLNAILNYAGMPIVTVPIPSEAWVLLNVGLGGYFTDQTVKSYTGNKYGNDKGLFDIIREIKGKPLTQTDVDKVNSRWKSGK